MGEPWPIQRRWRRSPTESGPRYDRRARRSQHQERTVSRLRGCDEKGPSVDRSDGGLSEDGGSPLHGEQGPLSPPGVVEQRRGSHGGFSPIGALQRVARSPARLLRPVSEGSTLRTTDLRWSLEQR